MSWEKLTGRESKAVAELVLTGVELDDALVIARYTVRRGASIWWFLVPDALERLATITDDPDRQTNLREMAAVMATRKETRVAELRRKHERRWARMEQRRRELGA